MLLLLVLNFVNGFKLELMHMSLIVNIRSSLTHIHGFQVLVQLLQYFFVCNSRINLLNLKQSSDRLVIITKRFLKLPN